MRATRIAETQRDIARTIVSAGVVSESVGVDRVGMAPELAMQSTQLTRQLGLDIPVAQLFRTRARNDQ
jgi:hypothetical protein